MLCIIGGALIQLKKFLLSYRCGTPLPIRWDFFIYKIMERIIIIQSGKLICVSDNYIIEEYMTKSGVKCKLYGIPEGGDRYAGYNDFHYGIEKTIHTEKIIKSWGDDYIKLRNKIDIDGRLKEKKFLKYFGTWLVDGFNCTHELGGKTFFYPSSLLKIK